MSVVHTASPPLGAVPLPDQPQTQQRLIMLLASLLVAATLFGGWRVATSSAEPAADAPPTVRLGDAIFAITHVERVDGLTNADLSGMAHGIQGLVLDDSTMIRVSVTVSAQNHRTAFDTSRLRVYRGASSSGLAPLGGSVGRGALSRHGSVEGAVSFVVPRDGARLSLGAVGTTARLLLLRIDDAPPGAGHMDMNMPGMTPPHHHHTEER
jgi:hypothetical protein